MATTPINKKAFVNQGKPGKPGSVWFNSVGIPLNSTGIEGDFCLDTPSGDVYKKINSAWSLIGSIKGPIGSNGSSGIVREVVVLTSSHIISKSITLTQVPSSADNVQFLPAGGIKQRYGVDFTITGLNTVSWASLGLDNFLEVNDSIELIYPV